MLQELKDQMQGPLLVSSGKRCDQQNDSVSTAKNKKNGVHTLGQASDILISGERAMLLFEKARKIGFSGIGLSQRGPHQDRFVHLDTIKLSGADCSQAPERNYDITFLKTFWINCP